MEDDRERGGVGSQNDEFRGSTRAARQLESESGRGCGMVEYVQRLGSLAGERS